MTVRPGTYDVGSDSKYALYEAIYGIAGDNNKATPVCPTGNCTWGPFSSLAVCSACTNLTSLLRFDTESQELDNSTYLWNLDDGSDSPNDPPFITSYYHANVFEPGPE